MRDVVREYIDWFAPHQFADGKVPCCVDHRGADPVVENDSHGEFVYLIAQYYRYTRDRDWLRSMWPHVAAAVSYMNALRAQGTSLGEPDARRDARSTDSCRRRSATKAIPTGPLTRTGTTSGRLPVTRAP